MSVDLPEPDEPMMATNSPAFDRETHAAQRMNVDVADVVGPRVRSHPDHRTSHDRSVGALRGSKPRPRHGALSGVLLFGDDDAVIRFQLALDDFGVAIVVETDDDRDRHGLSVTKRPDFRLARCLSRQRSYALRRHVTQRLVGTRMTLLR